MKQFSPKTNMVGECVDFSKEVTGIAASPGSDCLLGKCYANRDRSALVRAFWREEGNAYLTLAVLGTGELLDRVPLSWVVISRARAPKS